MNWTLEVVLVPVTDVERAKKFYAEQVGFQVDFDSRFSNSVSRLVQLTPPGSGCSIQIGTGITTMTPGSLQGLQLVVRDLKTAHTELTKRGVNVSDIQVYGKDSKLRPYREGDDLNNVGFIFFSDPDGNQWAVQQISKRL
jgi:catechol 2,3-dioxygenase-like lactoylglutathione lyase family enzyme